MIGTVLRYSREAGYGFIAAVNDPEGTLPDFFVHRRFLEGRHSLISGQQVEFEPYGADTPKPQAHHVRVVATTVARQVSDAVAEAEATQAVSNVSQR